jgi:TRAP-type mannitol/chloroaromatic compound transport system permease small subunit
MAAEPDPTPDDDRSDPPLARAISAFNRTLGHILAWGIAALIVLQIMLVIMQFVFKVSSIQLAEALLYINALVFLGAAGYALADNQHVRVDIFFREAPRAEKAEADLIGTLAFLLPFCAVIWWASWGYVANSWAIRERSIETSGLPFIYILKSFILLFATVLTMQAIAIVIRSLARLKERRP